MCDANGECDEFLLAHDRVPRVAYVYRLQARTCQNWWNIPKVSKSKLNNKQTL